MRYLLDTHCLLWWLTEPERLSAEAVDIISDADNDILVSVASSWEIAIKYALGKLPLPASPEQYLPSRLQRCRFGTLHIEHAHALRVALLPLHHRDPFDRLLIAQSQIDRVPIITVDRQFAAYKVKVIWG